MSEATYALTHVRFILFINSEDRRHMVTSVWTFEVLLLAPALYLVSQARLTSAKRNGSGELHVQTVYRHTLQCGTITIAVFCHMMHYMTV